MGLSVERLLESLTTYGVLPAGELTTIRQSPAAADPAADCEPLIRELAATVLTQLGYAPTLAADGAEAVDRFREAGGKFDLVILDLTMPNLTGREALTRIRDLVPDVPVIFASAESREAGEAALRKSAFPYLRKKRTLAASQAS